MLVMDLEDAGFDSGSAVWARGPLPEGGCPHVPEPKVFVCCGDEEPGQLTAFVAWYRELRERALGLSTGGGPTVIAELPVRSEMFWPDTDNEDKQGRV